MGLDGVNGKIAYQAVSQDKSLEEAKNFLYGESDTLPPSISLIKPGDHGLYLDGFMPFPLYVDSEGKLYTEGQRDHMVDDQCFWGVLCPLVIPFLLLSKSCTFQFDKLDAKSASYVLFHILLESSANTRAKYSQIIFTAIEQKYTSAYEHKNDWHKGLPVAFPLLFLSQRYGISLQSFAKTLPKQLNIRQEVANLDLTGAPLDGEQGPPILSIQTEFTKFFIDTYLRELTPLLSEPEVESLKTSILDHLRMEGYFHNKIQGIADLISQATARKIHEKEVERTSNWICTDTSTKTLPTLLGKLKELSSAKT